ncbi:MAG: CapA family protein [Spirochaetales bacterium]|jgi:hypothetical protein|nr:CapA family protein [Spirochaetales bacterium]
MFDKNGFARIKNGEETWSLVAAGDICPIARVEKGLLKGGPEAVMSKDIVEVLKSGGVTLVNLESPLCTQKDPIPKTGPNFIAAPEVADILKSAGVDIAALANNHILDQGAQGLDETIRVLDSAGIRSHGAGISPEQAAAPAVLTHEGRDIAFLNVAEGEFGGSQNDGPGAARLDISRTCGRIREAASSYDVVIVSVHAGNEYQPYPSPLLQDVYRQFVNAGAKVVVGHHPHISQGIEIYGSGIILYSLGNFLFDYEGHAGKACTKIGYLACLGFSGLDVVSIQLKPYRTLSNASIKLLSGGDRRVFSNYMNIVSAPLRADDDLKSLWEQEVVSLFSSTYMPLFTRIFSEMHENSNQAKPPLDGLMASAMFNLFRCEAHSEAIQTGFRLMHENAFIVRDELQARIDDALGLLRELLSQPH